MIVSTVNITMDFSAFSHGQIQSKLWLCQELEPYIKPNSIIAVLGCWYNLTGLMLCLRKNIHINSIKGIDKDPKAIELANDLCQSFMIQPNVLITNECQDVKDFNFNGYDVVINSSVEHMENNDWFDRINHNTLVCLQTSNRVTDDPVWDIKNPNPDFITFKNKFKLSSYHIEKTYHFQYSEYGYDRFMIIGKK